uniref:Aminotransferase-like plant mobile domain-containing protein n=1 Tax=Fagus sylvatica TaxID=28930 RepID=A0A2N9HR87_FAGSY
MPQLALNEDITIIFRPEEHLSYRAQNGEVVRSFMSQGNPTKVLKWWGRLNSLTRSYVEMDGFKHFMETQPINSAKKSLLCVLAERWWDTTHTFHIVDVEMTIIPYDERPFADLRSLPRAFAEAPQTTIEEATRMAQGFLLYLIGTTLDYNTSQTIPSWVLQYFTHALSRRPITHQREHLRKFFNDLTHSRSPGMPKVHIERIGSIVVDKRAYNLAQFSRLFEGPGAPANVPSTSGSIPAAPLVLADIILPSWSIPLYQADGSLCKTTITRHSNVLGYPVPKDARLATHADLNYMFQLCGNMKTKMTGLSRDCFSRPPVDHFSEAVDEECYPEALAIAVLAGFFLTGDFSEIDTVVLDAIGRMDRENPIAMILGEMLIDLDELKERMCPYFKGSPLLLQIWLYEHFALITAPE